MSSHQKSQRADTAAPYTEWKKRPVGREGPWYSRGYLRHCDAGGLTQFVTIRLADSLPQKVLRQLKVLLEDGVPEEQRYKKIELWIDRGYGSCVLRRGDIAELVYDSLRYFDGEAYKLHEWVMMPNHLHLLVTLEPGVLLSDIMRQFKSYTATRANAMLGREGPFWYRSYYDRYIRDENHFNRVVHYIHRNPVAAGLCKTPADWKYGSAHGNGKV